ncbi:Retron-type RNA-directed DNA polymerase [Colwellia sp. MSW7]|uniref:Retron-type RNA-directed DNA polymerase n=1 Tax=Colwellia maritima TaxID=2912588 RepID=A0ABS9X1N6_9GAMM|nr:Retron-type RNA-directed DNA polymerase [Colwellia maritima]MCI2284116.1 Retron-type RNA-directed DNA polymerase [Colwellia maritima]
MAQAKIQSEKSIKTGVPLALAISCGATRKGVWRSAKTKGINQALSNEYLANAGLVSLRDIWIKIHHG